MRSRLELRLAHFTPFHGNTCILILYFVQNHEILRLFSRKTVIEKQLLTSTQSVSCLSSQTRFLTLNSCHLCGLNAVNPPPSYFWGLLFQTQTTRWHDFFLQNHTNRVAGNQQPLTKQECDGYNKSPCSGVSEHSGHVEGALLHFSPILFCFQ